MSTKALFISECAGDSDWVSPHDIMGLVSLMIIEI